MSCDWLVPNGESEAKLTGSISAAAHCIHEFLAFKSGYDGLLMTTNRRSSMSNLLDCGILMFDRPAVGSSPNTGIRAF